MRKATCLLLCLISLILLTGCGKNKLICTKEDENKYVSYEYEISFKNDKVDEMSVTWYYDFSDIEDFSTIGCLSLEDCINKTKNQVDSCQGSNVFKDCEVLKEKDSTIVVKANVTDEELKSKTSILSKETEKDEAKKQLEAEGFTCK